jgi:hypothetical protein
MKPEDSLLHLQVPATCPNPEPDQSSPCPSNSCTLLIPKIQKTKLEILSEKMNEKSSTKFLWREGLK